MNSEIVNACDHILAAAVNGLYQGIIIAVLALADGVIHLLLDFILFGGRGGPPSGPRPAIPPGGPPPAARAFPFFLPLNVLFLLNFIGAVVLVLLFWFGPR